MISRWGGFLDHIDEFDAEFFGISPREAERLDPQQRLLLETAWEALEDAGQDVRKLDGARTGVFIGQWTSDFESRLFADPEVLDFYMAEGSGRYASSGRISYALGLRGPVSPLILPVLRRSSLFTLLCKAFAMAKVICRAGWGRQYHPAAPYQHCVFAKSNDGGGWSMQIRRCLGRRICAE